jgi:hypothetical protein
MQLREKKDQVRGKGFGSSEGLDNSLPVSLHNHIQYVVLFTQNLTDRVLYVKVDIVKAVSNTAFSST